MQKKAYKIVLATILLVTLGVLVGVYVKITQPTKHFDEYDARFPLPDGHVPVKTTDWNWEKDGVVCHSIPNNAQREVWENEVELFSALDNTIVESRCDLPDKSRWYSGTIRGYATKSFLLHLSETGAILHQQPGALNDAEQPAPCGIIAMRANEMAISCEGENGDYIRRSITIYNPQTEKKTVIWAEQLVDASAFCGKEGCSLLAADFKAPQSELCSPITRDDAKEMRDQIFSVFPKQYSVTSLGEYCRLYNGQKAVTVVISKIDPNGEERGSTIVLLDKTGAPIPTEYQLSWNLIPDQFLEAPRMVRTDGNNYYFLSNSVSESERHMQFFKVTTERVVAIQSDDEFRNKRACDTWEICPAQDSLLETDFLKQ